MIEIADSILIMERYFYMIKKRINSGLFAVETIQYNTIHTINSVETRLQYDWHDNKNTDGLVNRLASNLVILNQAHRVAWLLGQENIREFIYTV